MEDKEFVTLEIAKLFKELGYNEACYGYYLDKDVPYVEKGLKSGGAKYYGKHNEFDDFIYSAPLWQQATAWLNKEYGLFINLEDSRHGEPTDKSPNGYMYYVTQYGHCVIGRGTNCYPTEYEARLAAIVMSIGFIKDVLNNE